jgi:hypothetical protein
VSTSVHSICMHSRARAKSSCGDPISYMFDKVEELSIKHVDDVACKVKLTVPVLYAIDRGKPNLGSHPGHLPIMLSPCTRLKTNVSPVPDS